MSILWIVLLLIILLIIERIIVCSKKSVKICPNKVNKLTIKNKPVYIFSGNLFEYDVNGSSVTVSKDNMEVIIKGKLSKIPVHASEKLKSLKFDIKQPINSLCSVWDCYTNVAGGNLFDNYMMVSEEPLKGICICNDEVFF